MVEPEDLRLMGTHMAYFDKRTWQHDTLVQLKADALPTAALAFDVWIVVDEHFVEAFPAKVDAGAVQVRQALVVDENFDTVALIDIVVAIDIGGEVDYVSESRTTRRSHAKSESDTRIAFGEEVSDSMCCRFSECNGHSLRW